MQFPLLVGVILLLAPFSLMVRYRARLSGVLNKVRLPGILLALLVSLPLAIYEENINCGAFGCPGPTLFPPTIPFLLVLNALFFLILRFLPLRNVFFQTALFSILGVLFEIFLGSSRAEFQALFFDGPASFALISSVVGVSYAFFLFLPLMVIQRRGNTPL